MEKVKKISKKSLCIILAILMVVGTITVVFTTKSFREMIEAKTFLSDYAKRIVSTNHVIGLDKTSMVDSRVIAMKNSNGSVTYYGFSEPVTYKDAKGNLKSKDISILKQKNKALKEKGFDYTNGDNDYRINISSDIRNGVNAAFNGSSYTLIPNVSVKEEKNAASVGNGTLYISPLVAAVSPTVLSVSGEIVENKADNTVSYTYSDIYGEGTSLSVEPQLNGVNEKIVLCDVASVDNISFTFCSEDSTPVLQEDGSIAIINNETKQAAQTIGSPILSTENPDSEAVVGEVFGRGAYTLEENDDDSYTLGIDIPDRSNIDISEYGDLVITIPGASIMSTGSGHISATLDTGIYTGTPSACYNNEITACFGRDSGFGYGRALTYFTMPAAIKRGATIHSAYFWTRETTGETSTTVVQPFVVNDTWTSQTTWNTRPGFASTSTMSRRNISSNSGDVPGNPYWYKFNVAQAVNLWVKATKVNRGIIFKSEEETNHNYRWRAFATREYPTSSTRPYTVIEYTNDTTAPTFQRIDLTPPPENGWTQGPVRITVVGASDSGAGLHPSPYSFSLEEDTYAWQENNYRDFYSNRTVYIGLRDYNFNSAIIGMVVIDYIDAKKPNTPTATVSETGWSQNNVSITVQADDANATAYNGKSGVKYYSCTQTAGQYNWVALDDDNLNGSYTFTNISNGTYYIYSKDVAGNICETPATVTANVDPEAPVVSSVDINTNAGNNSSSVNIKASDVTSGINAYSLNGGQDWTDVNPSTNNLDITVNSTLNNDSIDVRVKDLSGRVSDGNEVALSKPEFYDYNGMVGIFNPNLNGAAIEYKIGDDDDWNDYEKPIEIDESSVVYAKYSNGANVVYNQFAPPAASADYVDSQTDLTITNNNLSFELSREYNSGDNEWYFSTESSAELTHNAKIIEITMPSGVKTYYVKTAENTYADEITGYTLNETADNYIINADGEIYTYNKSNGRLADISDAFEHHIEFSYNLLGELESITATSGNEEHQYLVSENNGKIEYIKTPIARSSNTNEKLVYQYTADGLIKVYYDKDTLQFERSDDIIKNEYGYTNDKLTLADGNTVNYDNEGHYLSLTTPAGETIENDGESVSTEPEQQTNVESEQEELDFTSEYPIFYSGTEIVQYEKTGYILDGIAYITQNEYNTNHQLLEVTETHISDYDTADAQTTYTKVIDYTYFDGTDIIHTETITETEGNTTTTTVNTYNSSSQLISVTQTQTKTNGAGGTDEVYSRNVAYTYFENTNTVHTETVTETADSTTSTTVITYNTMSSIISEAVTENGKTTETAHTYDIWGNVLTSVTTLTENGVPAPVSSTSYVYDALNRCIKVTLSEPNSDPVVTHKAYNPLGDVIFEKSGNDVTRTLYDKYGRAIQEIEPIDYSASADGIAISENTVSGDDTYSDSSVGHRYVYNETTRLLTSETNRLGVETAYTYHANSSVVASESFDIYRYEYNESGNLEYIYVANSTPAYAHYVYENDKNTQVQYGNGQTIYYTYNNDGKILTQSYTETNEETPVTQFVYSYNAVNELVSKTDYISNQRTDYNSNTVSVYDISGNSDVLLYSYENVEENHDENTSTTNPATSEKSYAGNTLNITYGSNSNQYTLNNNNIFSVDSAYTNDLLSSTVINNASNQSVVSKSFTYDSNKNITGLTVNNTSISYVYDDDKITEYHQGNNAAYYTYDSKEQLVREDIDYTNYSRTITYTYDNRGNLTEKKEYAFTRSEILGTPLETNALEFEYEDELWLDEIVETPDETILYDENGNPVNLNECTLEWTNGRQLKSVANGNDVILEYTYDDFGIRTSKTYQGQTTYYTTENGIITSQYQLDNSGNKTNEVIFIYDNGVLVSAYYNNTMFYYITNAMGDVISIIDGNGNTVVDYCYDAWGNIVDKVANTSLSTDFSDVNPMLYRSYYWDNDLGVYYLQSRYYKSDWCRFVNSDFPQYAIIQKEQSLGLNAFAYCYNNAVNYVDFTGQLAIVDDLIIFDLLLLFLITGGTAAIIVFVVQASTAINISTRSSSSSKNKESESDKVLKKIPDSLKTKDKRKVDLGKFKKKLKGNQGREADNGWRIQADKSGHKGSKWKLKNRSGKRVASLKGDGTVVGK